jgi:hypothetical protein
VTIKLNVKNPSNPSGVSINKNIIWFIEGSM